jgi:hypothetical protein
MSASPSYEYCERCSEHVDDCECRTCDECGVTLSAWYEEGRECSRCVKPESGEEGNLEHGP